MNSLVVGTPERVAFAAQRRTAQDSAIEVLRPLVDKALSNYGEENWWRPLLAPVRDLFNTTLSADSGGDVTRDVRAWAALSATIRRTLPRTTQPDNGTIDRLATWLAIAAINAAATSAAAHDSEPLLLEWVTMHDSNVRHAHAETDGQQRPPGESFDIEGHPLRYPGDSRAPVDLWINCRCVVRPTPVALDNALAASVGEAARHGRVLVALPTEDDPSHDLSLDEAHLTLIWLGKADENPRLDMDAVRAEIEVWARDQQPMTAEVTGIDVLGDEHATVWLLAEDEPTWLRSDALRSKSVRDGYEAVKQFPRFTPHVTIGYDLMLSGDGIEQLSGVKKIAFDRIAVWDGQDRTEYRLGGQMLTDTTTAAVEADPEVEPVNAPLRWHGVLAPENVWSGDGRMFATDSLRFRDLPLPLTWQKVSAAGHDGSVVIAMIESIWRQDGLMMGEGPFVDTPETDEAVGLIAEFGKFGVSVDADDASFEFDEDTEKVTFTSARIASASMVAIPAFAEAFIALGTWADAQPPGQVPSEILDVCDPDSPNYDADVCAQQQAQAPDDEMAGLVAEFVSDKPWSQFTQADYTDDQWYSACVLHKNGSSHAKGDNGLPIKEPGGALNRNGVHAAAGRFNQVQAPPEAKAAAARALRGAYSTLGEDPPDAIKAAAEVAVFKRGPGWITNPEDTKRIHDYWTKPGKPGYAKIGWGTPGDFNRCRVEVGEEIAENSPDKVRFLNQICAQWHHDATGFWPGDAPAERTASGEPAPALSLVASVATAPHEWFTDPKFTALTPITVAEDGRVFGHLCGWESCHTGFDGICVAPPESASGYAYFLTGEVLTDGGPVPVGQITVGGGHAGKGLAMRPAVAHYDATSAAVADVTCGQDDHGIWLAGWVRPGATDEQVYALRAAAPSGDWRKVAGNMELIAAHSVNVQGFPVPRVGVGVQNNVQVSLVAAGSFTVEPEPDGQFNVEEFAEHVAAAIEARAQRRTKMAALAARVGG